MVSIALSLSKICLTNHSFPSPLTFYNTFILSIHIKALSGIFAFAFSFYGFSKYTVFVMYLDIHNVYICNFCYASRYI